MTCCSDWNVFHRLVLGADERSSYGKTITMKLDWDHKGRWLGLALLLFLSIGLWIALDKGLADAYLVDRCTKSGSRTK
jgi:hypothetical protein